MSSSLSNTRTTMNRNAKNFYTEFQSVKSVKSLITLTDYITDRNDKHINHQGENHKTIVFDTQEVIDKKLRNVIDLHNIHHTRIKLNRKGGRPSSPATSIMVSLPPKIRNKEVDTQTMKKFHDLMISDIVKKMNEVFNIHWTPSEQNNFISDFVISSIHMKDNNPHLNIMLASVVRKFKSVKNDKEETIRKYDGLQKIRLGLRKFSNQVKLLATQNMARLGFSLSDYTIQKARTSKRLNPVASLKQDIKEEKEKQVQLTQNLESKLEQQEKTNELIQTFLKRMEIYEKRMQDAIESGDTKKMQKNEKLYQKAKDKYDQIRSALKTSYSNDTGIDLSPKPK